jgi:Zn-dependent oligopeptidase
VRELYFLAFSNTSKANFATIAELCKIRRDYAFLTNKTFFDFQQKRNILKIPGDFKSKINQIRKRIEKASMEDLDIIAKITGVKEIRYYDMVYLKELLRGILLAGDQNNIQMLYCFTLENVLNGLLILLKDLFRKDCIIKTIILDNEGKIVREILGKFERDVDPSQD